MRSCDNCLHLEHDGQCMAQSLTRFPCTCVDFVPFIPPRRVRPNDLAIQLAVMLGIWALIGWAFWIFNVGGGK